MPVKKSNTFCSRLLILVTINRFDCYGIALFYLKNKTFFITQMASECLIAPLFYEKSNQSHLKVNKIAFFIKSTKASLNF